MAKAVIKVEGLTKEYRIGKRKETSFRDSLTSLFSKQARRDEVIFKALDGINFEINRGEAVGIIGRNGAGKSTLLKVLSRITEPTNGRISIEGRVASLLEVGTGFHPELTGRENVFLNGTILGMSREEVRQKFDEILDFSGVEKFVDTPVKHYSSGMYVRLAFSVAAHLEPEILIVDEVLAVGDADFQKKCLGKMGDVAGEGRTVLFVSHNMGAVRSLCSSAILISNGQLVVNGNTDDVIGEYSKSGNIDQSAYYSEDKKEHLSGWFTKIQIRDKSSIEKSDFSMDEEIILEIEYVIDEEYDYNISAQIKELNQTSIAHMPNVDAGFKIKNTVGRHKIRISIPALYLYPNDYLIGIALVNNQKGIYDTVDLAFRINQNTSLISRPLVRSAGIIFHKAEWDYLS